MWRPRPREAEAWAGGGRRGGRAESQPMGPPAASRGGGDSGPGRAAATGCRHCLPRRRLEGPPGGGEQVRGQAGPGGEAGSLSGGHKRRGPAPRGRAARPGLRHPFPAAAAAPAGYPRGAVGPWALLGALRSHGQVGSCEVPGSGRGWVARSPRDANVVLFKW